MITVNMKFKALKYFVEREREREYHLFDEGRLTVVQCKIINFFSFKL